MTAVEHGSRPSRPDSGFYPAMAGAIALAVFIGFSRSFYLKSVFHAPPELSSLMVVLGIWLAIDALRRGYSPDGAPPPVIFFAIPFFDMVAFATIITMGIANRTRFDWHKRLMILSNAALLDAAFARFPFDAIEKGGAPVYFLLADLVIVAMAIYDWRQTKRVHPATLWAGGIVVGSQILRLAVAGTAIWASFAMWLAG